MATKIEKLTVPPEKSVEAESFGVVLLKAGSQEFRIPTRLGKDKCGY